MALTASGGQTQASDQQGPFGGGSDGVKLRLRLEVPEEADEGTLFRTLDLVQHGDFQRARRLWGPKTRPSPATCALVRGMPLVGSRR